MRLLVSVRNSREAEHALAGGADIIDAKEPSRGALAPVALPILRDIDQVVPPGTMLSVALGDAESSSLPGLVGDVPALSTRSRLAFKAAITDCHPAAAARHLAATCDLLAARPDHPVLVVARYVDAPAHVEGLEAWIAVSARSGARGLLLDTSRKDAPGLLRLVSVERLRALREAARAAGIWFVLAGGLRLDDLEVATAIDPDVIGVRGAACSGGREGELSLVRVRDLQARLLALSPREAVPRA